MKTAKIYINGKFSGEKELHRDFDTLDRAKRQFVYLGRVWRVKDIQVSDGINIYL